MERELTEHGFSVFAEVDLLFDWEIQEVTISKGDHKIVLDKLETKRLMDTLKGKLYSLRVYDNDEKYTPNKAYFWNSKDGSSKEMITTENKN